MPARKKAEKTAKPGSRSKGRASVGGPDVSREQARWYRLRRSGLVRAFSSPAEAARSHLGIQAQINSAARLALWQRLQSDGGEEEARELRASIERSLEKNGELVRLWGQRGTLHLYATEDWPLVSAAMGEREIARVEQRRAKAASQGTMVGHRKALELARAGLKRDGRIAKADIEAKGGRQEVESHYGAFLVLTLSGHASRIDTADNASPELIARSKLHPSLGWRPPVPEEAMKEVARRFFDTYGPATEKDLRYWLSAAAGDTKPVVESLKTSEELVPVSVAGQEQLVASGSLEKLTDKPPPASQWPVCLLGRFDPLILAHQDKSCWIEKEQSKKVWHQTHVEPVLLVGGRIAGTWRSKKLAKGIRVRLSPLGEISRAVARAAERQARGIAAFLGTSLLDLEVVRE